MISQAVNYAVEDWTLPESMPRYRVGQFAICPFVGIPFPAGLDIHYKPHERVIKRVWFQVDSRSWKIRPFRRRALYQDIKKHYDLWFDWLVTDSTPTFYYEVSTIKKANDGIIVGVAGPKGSGKSFLSSMTLTRLISTIPHVLFRYRDLKVHIRNFEDLKVGIQIDEDLKSTGAESKTLAVHVNNAFETGRKAELNVVCTGVNLNFEGWGDTLDLRLIPWGYNVRFQATRAAVWTKKNEFLGLIMIQRKHRAADPVRYHGEMGVWGEYKARAIAYSIGVIKEGGASGAVDSVTETRHIETLKEHMREEYVDPGRSLPKGIMLDRLYRKAGLPANSIRYMSGVIAWSLAELEDERRANQISLAGEGKHGKGFQPKLTAEGWGPLLEGLIWLFSDPSVALYYCPPHPKASDREIVEIEGLGIEPPSLGTSRRRRLKDIATSEIGRLGERVVEAWLESLGARAGSGGKGTADVMIRVDGKEAALNVKLTLKDHFKESLEVTPEDRFIPRALAVLVIPRQLQIRVYKITGPVMTLNWHKGVLATPHTLADVITEMLENGDG